MKRRNFITSITGATILGALGTTGNVQSQSSKTGKLKPKSLKSGDTIGIVAPGSAVTNPEDYMLVEEIADYLELKIKYASNVKKGSGYKTRTIRERADDIHEMFADKTVSAVFCIRGGYGSGQLLDSLSYQIIKSNPKVFLGYSDITALHLAINKMTGLVTFHGPVMLSDFSDLTAQSLKRAIFSNQPIGSIENPVNPGTIRASHPVRTINPGKATGELTGGNLSLIASLMGTRYEINTQNSILFLEDVGEPPYSIDRMLTQLKTAGKLKQAKAVVFGRCEDCTTGTSASTWDSSLGEVLDSIFSDIKIPVFYGLNIGHSTDQFTIPIGVNAKLDSDKCIIDIVESSCI